MRSKTLRYFSVIVVFLMVAIIGGTFFLIPRNQEHSAQAAGFPARFFAPYNALGIGGSIDNNAQAAGVKYISIAFENSNGGCSLGTPFSASSVNNIRNAGGDVILSFGGYGALEVAMACSDPASTQQQYQSIINTYNLTRLDFDIEHGGPDALANTAANDRRNKALTALESANPNLKIGYTLPVDASAGLPNDALALIHNAVSNNTRIDTVNIMTMDYGYAVADMGAAANQAATATFNQLQGIYPNKTAAQIWMMIGITPMIGQNDTPGEIFTLANAQTVLSFAQQHNVGELAFWSIGRDNGGCPGNTTASPTCSGVSQNNADFSRIFEPYNGGTTPPTSTPKPGSTNTPKPVATNTPVGTGGCTAAAWNSSTVYTNGMQASYNGHLWTAQWWTQGDIPGGTTNPGVWKDNGACSGGPTNTPKPVATNTPKPVATNTPKPGSTNTPKPAATNTPKPGATNTPKPAATNTPVSGVAPWTIGVTYSPGNMVTYGGHTYKCIQTNTAQAGWEPPNVPALWGLVS